MMMLTAGITIVVVMSAVSMNSFLTGLDVSTLRTMHLQADAYYASEENPIKINNYFVAKNWEDLPAEIKEHIKEKALRENELTKYIDGNPIFSRPKAGYFAIKFKRQNKIVYVAAIFKAHNEKSLKEERIPHPLYIILMALITIAIFSLFPYVILRLITTPVEKLISWAKQLDKDKVTKAPPDFRYSELNSLAKIVQSSLQSVQEGLQREQEFLGYASHELRTPIAVTRTNAELLRKMIQKDVSTEKQLQVLDRIERAHFNMTDLTETLLWLNRKTEQSIPLKEFSIGLLTQQLVEELTYLVSGKKIEINIEHDQTTQQLPEALCRIIINNLIRNAFQHTNEGTVLIRQTGNKLIIHNQDQDENESFIKNELGFGLGLELTERLVKHYGWEYTNLLKNDGYYVEIIFS